MAGWQRQRQGNKLQALFKKKRESWPCVFYYIWILDLFLQQPWFQSKHISANVLCCGLLNPGPDGCTVWAYEFTTVTADLLVVQPEGAFSVILKTKLLAENNFSGGSDVAECENLEDGLSCYFITPKTPVNTLKSDSLVTFWTPESKTKGGPTSNLF